MLFTAEKEKSTIHIEAIVTRMVAENGSVRYKAREVIDGHEFLRGGEAAFETAETFFPQFMRFLTEKFKDRDDVNYTFSFENVID